MGRPAVTTALSHLFRCCGCFTAKNPNQAIELLKPYYYGGPCAEVPLQLYLHIAQTYLEAVVIATKSCPKTSCKEAEPYLKNLPNGDLQDSDVANFVAFQLGAFGDEESARLVYEKLKSLGYQGSIVLPSEQNELYRLVIGPFKTEKEADAISRKLNELDFPSFVIESL